METHPTRTSRNFTGLRPPQDPMRQSGWQSGPHPRYHLLVIAIDEYLHWKPLKTAVRGAKAFVRVLRSRFGVRAEDVIEVFNTQASRKGIIDALERMARRLGPDDHWILFFAGHGHRDELLNSGAWIPFDCPAPESGAAAVWVKHSEVKEWVRATKARQVLILADSCFAGDLLGEARRSAETVTPEQLERWASVRSRRAFTSGGIEPVYDGRPDGHSVFMGPLLDALKGLADAAIHSGRLCDRVDGEMILTGSPQRPWEGPLPETGDDPGGRFVLMRSDAQALPEEVEPGTTSPQRAEWAHCLMRERDVADRLQATRLGRHRDQSDAAHAMARLQSDLDDLVSLRTSRTPAGWAGQPVETAVMACAREPHASLVDAKDRVRALGVAVPAELGTWWKLLREELPLQARCTEAQDRLAQVTGELVTRLEVELGEARQRLNAAREALVEAVMGEAAAAESLCADGRWPSAEARSHWLSRCESALPGDDAQLLEVLEVRSPAFVEDRVWAVVSGAPGVIGLQGYLSGPPGAVPGFVLHHADEARAALAGLDEAAAARARAMGTVEAWTAYLAEFPEGRARSEAIAVMSEARWQSARLGLVAAVETWLSGAAWPTDAALSAWWQSWLADQGLPTSDLPDSWTKEAWEAVAAAVWRRVVATDSRAAYEAYLTGPKQWLDHRAEAEEWLAAQSVRERQRAEAAAWEKARKVGSAAEFRLYLQQWPEGEHVREAAIAWAALAVETPPVPSPGPRPSPATPPPWPSAASPVVPPPLATPVPATPQRRTSGWTWSFAGVALGLSVWIAVLLQASGKSTREGQQLASELRELTERVLELTSPRLGQPFRDELGMEYVWIPAGSFRMGSPDGVGRPDERPETEVTISRGFWMGKTPVRQKDWERVMGTNGSYFKGAELPVESVDWNQAVAFGQKRTEHRAGRLPEGMVFRLPTEAEWEYAARAGTTTKWSFGEEESRLGEYAWFEGNSGSTTHPVGIKLPNPWGLHDMHGNVWQWCSDYRGGGYSGGQVTDPTGPATGSDRVIRGGSFNDSADYCRSASRISFGPGLRWFHLGFRLVLAPRSVH